jgi:CHAT domain-containing protein
LKPALRNVWDKIVVPIFEHIGVSLVETGFLPQRRIWWYLTGPLTFIPIHAAGSGKRGIDVGRLVISSYVPVLVSLLEVQKVHQRVPSSKGHRQLSISQPQTPGQSFLPHTTEEANRVAQVFRSSGWSEKDIVGLHGSKATVESVSNALDSCSWVHFACHGFQDPNQGMRGAFALHDGYLKLSEIASKRLSNGRFAFLSACQTASGLKDLPGEAMHLAAGLQFAGLPSVIATMWSICDEDVPKVADHTYQYIFRNELQGLDTSEAAVALNRAIWHLREDTITVYRWAPFGI